MRPSFLFLPLVFLTLFDQNVQHRNRTPNLLDALQSGLKVIQTALAQLGQIVLVNHQVGSAA